MSYPIYVVNPRRRRAKSRRRPAVSRRRRRVAVSRPRRIRRRARRRSTSMSLERMLLGRRRRGVRRARNPRRHDWRNYLLAAFGGAAGGLVTDALLNLVPLPSMFQSGLTGDLTKLAGGGLVAWAAEKAGKGRPGAKTLADGILGAVGYEVTRNFLVNNVPSLAAFVSPSVSVPTVSSSSGGVAGLGTLQATPAYLSPAPVVGRLPQATVPGFGTLQPTPAAMQLTSGQI